MGWIGNKKKLTGKGPGENKTRQEKHAILTRPEVFFSQSWWTCSFDNLRFALALFFLLLLLLVFFFFSRFRFGNGGGGKDKA